MSSNSSFDKNNYLNESYSPISIQESEPMIELTQNKKKTYDEEEGFQNEEDENDEDEDNILITEEEDDTSLTLKKNISNNSKSELNGHSNGHSESELSPESRNTSFLPSFPFDETWPSWSMEVFQKWPIFLSLALPAALSLFLEWGSYEVMAGFAGQLGSIQLATHGVYMNTASLAYNGPMAIADATSVLTGNYLGKNQPTNASSMVLLGVSIDSILGLITGGILLFFLRSTWGYLFTTDIDVIIAVTKYMPILFIYMFVDSVKCVTCNVLRSTGRPAITTYGNLFCCIFILIPSGWYLAIEKGYGLIGLWGGMSIGWGLAAMIYSFVLYQTDWKQQAKDAYERNCASLENSQANSQQQLPTQIFEHS